MNVPLTEENAFGHFEQYGKSIHQRDSGWHVPLPPGVVYHYTNASALESILRTGQFWATDHRYCNDRSEGEYGKEIALEVGDKLLKGKLPNIARAVIEATLRRITAPGDGFVFLVCFSEEGDSLGQWRSYANSGRGFAIGLDTSRPLALGSDMPLWLRPLVYDPAEQRQQVANVFATIIDLTQDFLDNVPPEPQAIERFASLAHWDITLVSQTLKHPAFAYEREWRLIVTSEWKFPIEFRAGALGLAPFVRNTIRIHEAPDEGRLPLTELAIGPNLDASLNTAALRLMLGQLGYKGLAIRASTVPLRD